MNVQLSDEQHRLVVSAGGEPIEVLDPVSNERYVLLRAEEYDKLRSFVAERFDLTDGLSAQIETAWAAGWADPVMDEYDRYGQEGK